MKKLALLVFIIIPLLLLGASKLPYPIQGDYIAKFVQVPKDEFFSKDYLIHNMNEAVLTDTKPDELTIDPAIKINMPKYGSIMLGDNNKKVYFVMGQDRDGYWTDFYIDQRLDYKITADEKVPGIIKWQLLRGKNGWDLRQTEVTDTPLMLTVSYNGSHGEIKRKLRFFVWTRDFVKEGEPEQTFVDFENDTAVEGFLKILVKKEEKLVKYRIIDAICTGCYNTYGKDILYLDLDYAGRFQKKEATPLYELFDTKVDKQVTQMRFIIPACPAKISIAPAEENPDMSQLEAQSDN